MPECDEFSLQREWMEMPGYRVYRQSLSIGRSFGIFTRNHEELIARLKMHSAAPLSLFGVGRRRLLDTEFQEITRLLHNYVSSVMSLRDHTLRAAKKLLGPRFKVYQSKALSEFKDDEITSFLHDLRNNLLHYAPPAISRVTKWADATSPPVTTIQLPKKDLLKWNGWNAGSRRFIQRQEQDIDILPSILMYYQKISSFYGWLQALIEETRKDDLAPFWSKHDEWVQYCKNKGIPTTDEEWQKWAEEEARNLRHT